MDVLGHGLSFRSHADDGDRGTVERKKARKKRKKSRNDAKTSR